MASTSVFNLADAVDQLVALFCPDHDKRSVGAAQHKAQRSAEVLGLFACLVLWLIIWADYTNEGFSATETASAAVELGGLVSLALRVHSCRSVAGLSTQSLAMYVSYFVLRLSSTTILDGYLPACKSADWIYQALQCLSLFVTLHIIYTAHKTYPLTYNEEEDTVPVLPLILPLIVTAYLGRHTFNNDVFFDTVWWTSGQVRALSLVPQIVLMLRVCGKPSVIPSAFVFLQTMSAVMTFSYWKHAHTEMVHKDGGVKTQAAPGYFIVAICTMHLATCGALLWQYVENYLALRENALENRMDSTKMKL